MGGLSEGSIHVCISPCTPATHISCLKASNEHASELHVREHKVGVIIGHVPFQGLNILGL